VGSIALVIYCVVPEAMGEDLFDRMVDYYADDPNVTVIKDRRSHERRGKGDAQHDQRANGDGEGAERHERVLRDRRRRRPGDFPPLTLEG
jgi:hypothetical protein